MEKKDFDNIGFILDLLDIYDLEYWLDHGTLLGVIRDGDLIPWDTDFDISMMREAWECIDEGFFQKLIEMGWSVYRGPYKIKIFPGYDYGKIKNIDIGSYYSDDDCIFNIYLPRRFGFIGDFFNEILHSLRTEGPLQFDNLNVIKNKSKVAHYFAYGLAKTFDMMPNCITRNVIKFISFVIYKYLRVNIPSSLLSGFKIIEFNNKNVRVPNEPENYLEYKYGEDWYIPKKEFRGITDFLTN